MNNSHHKENTLISHLDLELKCSSIFLERKQPHLEKWSLYEIHFHCSYLIPHILKETLFSKTNVLSWTQWAPGVDISVTVGVKPDHIQVINCTRIYNYKERSVNLEPPLEEPVKIVFEPDTTPRRTFKEMSSMNSF